MSIRGAYFSNYDALIAVVDSDDSPIHHAQHVPESEPQCRFCQLKQITQRELATLKPLPDREPLRVALGTATPSLEAWLCFGSDNATSEAVWPHRPYDRRKLKHWAYGDERASVKLQIERGIPHVQRICRDFDGLLKAFPAGFAPLYNEMLSWRPTA